MSSPLDARIRALAIEEGTKLFLTREEMEQAGGTAVFQTPPDRVAELEQQVAALTARVEAMEKAPRQARTARKGTGE